MNKAIFLDRDGTINVDKGYLYKPEDFEFIDGVPEAIKKMHELGYLVIVITNQSGVARGYYTENDIEILHQYIDAKLNGYGTWIDAYYYCPHHPKAIISSYRKECSCRKPNNGLFKRAMQEWNINPRASWAIGDKERDIEPARNLNIKTVLISKDMQLKDCVKEYLYDS